MKRNPKHDYRNLRRILEKLRQEIKQEFNREIFLQDINQYLCNGAYQKVHRMKKDEDKYSWIQSGKRPLKNKSLESKIDKIKKKINLNKENQESMREEYRKLCNKYQSDLSRTDLNQGNTELRKFYEKVREYERNFLDDEKIDFLPGRWKKSYSSKTNH